MFTCVHMRRPGDSLSCYPQLLSSSFFERVSFTGLELADCRQGWLTAGKASSLQVRLAQYRQSWFTGDRFTHCRWGCLPGDRLAHCRLNWLSVEEAYSLQMRLAHCRQGWLTVGKTGWPASPKQLLVIFMVYVTQVCYHQAQLFWDDSVTTLVQYFTCKLSS